MKKVTINDREYDFLEENDTPTPEQEQRFRDLEGQMIAGYNNLVIERFDPMAVGDNIEDYFAQNGKIFDDVVREECKDAERGGDSKFGNAYLEFRALWGRHRPTEEPEGCMGGKFHPGVYTRPYGLQLHYFSSGQLVTE